MRSAELRGQIEACQQCKLHKIGNGPVPFRGRPSDRLILGEAPGRREDETGKPFVGPAGKLLWEELAKLGLMRDDVMAANAVCCYPERTPTNAEVFACRGNLYLQVKHCRPKHILALGKVVNSSLGKEIPMSELHGAWYGLGWFHQWPLIDVLPTYHPAAVLRNRTLMKAWRTDLKSFVEVSSEE